ncbi:hypothetical protein V6N11_035556 [Hibiscus sabdariffa]|uniref:Uncharacterized protein n=2 Tax=Hibiscus sabdariffa TaxID=183260 RepID=A0ABR2R0S2_9ROSI
MKICVIIRDLPERFRVPAATQSLPRRGSECQQQPCASLPHEQGPRCHSATIRLAMVSTNVVFLFDCSCIRRWLLSLDTTTANLR